MRLVLVPAVPALLPEYAGLTDPVPDLRVACAAGVEWLLADGPERVAVVGEPSNSIASRIGLSLLASAGGPVGTSPSTEADAVVIVANGSARRGEKAPGHLDERSFAFDQALGAALKTGDLDALAGLDLVLAEELLTAGLEQLRDFASGLDSWRTTELLHDDDPFGVHYWVVTALCEP